MTLEEEKAWFKAIELEADKLSDETGLDWFLAFQQICTRRADEISSDPFTGPHTVQQPTA